MVEVMRFAGVWLQVLAARVRRDEVGATAVEYGLMVALIAAVILTAVGLLGTQVRSAFCTVVDAIGGSCPAP